MPCILFLPAVYDAGSGVTTCFYVNRFLKRMMRFPIRRLYRRAGVVIASAEIQRSFLRA